MNRFFFKILGAFSQCQKNNKSSVITYISTNRNFTLMKNIAAFQSLRLTLKTAVKLNILLSERKMSTKFNDEDDKKKPKMLMKFEPVLRPEVLLTIKNWILAKFIIRPYLDNEFTLKDFTSGAKQALTVVSSFLSQGDFQSLAGLVTDEAITEIKRNFAALNVKERQDLFVKVADILFAFPYQVGIIFDDSNQRRFAEITVVYHCMNDFEELKSQGKALTEDAKEDIKICNYRFIREYTKGVQSDWIINRLGHFKLRHFEN
ncbi:hypothetical protein X975_19857, partial [Stegodyphus mimosarum]